MKIPFLHHILPCLLLSFQLPFHRGCRALHRKLIYLPHKLKWRLPAWTVTLDLIPTPHKFNCSRPSIRKYVDQYETNYISVLILIFYPSPKKIDFKLLLLISIIFLSNFLFKILKPLLSWFSSIIRAIGSVLCYATWLIWWTRIRFMIAKIKKIYHLRISRLR